MWDDKKIALYRAEIERRFRARTPAKSIIDATAADRVGRGEMRGWCLEAFGELPPDTDRDWLTRQAKWYRGMALRVLAELDPAGLAIYRKQAQRIE